MTEEKSTTNTLRNVIEAVLCAMMLAALAVASWVGNEARLELVKVAAQQEAQAQAINDVKELVKETRIDWSAKIEKHEQRIQRLEVELARRNPMK